jgi:hypothetical protein
LDHIAPERSGGDCCCDQPNQTLSTDDHHLGTGPIFHDRHKRHNCVMGKVGVPDVLVRLVQDVSALERYDLQMRLKIGQTGWVESPQEAVCGFRRNPDRYSDLKPDSIPE